MTSPTPTDARPGTGVPATISTAPGADAATKAPASPSPGAGTARSHYAALLGELLGFTIPRGARVLNVSCDRGHYLAALEPAVGVGIDLDATRIAEARARFPDLTFLHADIETLEATEIPGAPFDYVVLTDALDLLNDVEETLRKLHAVMTPHSRLVLTYRNHLWEPADRLLGWKTDRTRNWFSFSDLQNILELAHFAVVRRGSSVLAPFYVPLVSSVLNRWVAKLPGIRHLCLVEHFVARPERTVEIAPRPETVTVVIPCRNEAGNIADAVRRTPVMGAGTELVFVDGSSDDGTVAAIEEQVEAAGSGPDRHPARRFDRVTLIHQGEGQGKGDAVRKGFAEARGGVLMILDADLTVAPEDLPKFYRALVEDRGEFVNGSRLVYPMERQAMRFLNLVGNKFFGLALSSILGQPVKDTLCGTKVLRRTDYQRIVAGRDFFGDFDPFGDFDLLFGAAKANLRIVEMPVRYRARTYGETKIHRFRHGFLLLRMTRLALFKFRFSRI